MDKIKFIARVCDQLTKDIITLKEAAIQTAEDATHEESKPENQYDTRALEASYLAGAQSKRIVDTEELLLSYRHLNPKKFAKDEAIDVTALVEIRLNGKISFLFVALKGGGLSVEFEGQRIQIITPSSPLGEALMGLKAGQVAEVEKGDQLHEYEIISCH